MSTLGAAAEAKPQCVAPELDNRIDTGRVTKGAHIEHL
jgi:hypothetical protein